MKGFSFFLSSNFVFRFACAFSLFMSNLYLFIYLFIFFSSQFLIFYQLEVKLHNMRDNLFYCFEFCYYFCIRYHIFGVCRHDNVFNFCNRRFKIWVYENYILFQYPLFYVDQLHDVLYLQCKCVLYSFLVIVKEFNIDNCKIILLCSMFYVDLP